LHKLQSFSQPRSNWTHQGWQKLYNYFHFYERIIKMRNHLNIWTGQSSSLNHVGPNTTSRHFFTYLTFAKKSYSFPSKLSSWM
jgi:hypothetical protein